MDNQVDRMEEIRELCKHHTHLNETDIDLIVNKSLMLQTIADIAAGDVFIDCMDKDQQTMLVIAEAFPETTHSLYKRSILGKRIYQPKEPAVYGAYQTGRPSLLHRAVFDGTHVKQNVTPIVNSRNQTIGVLILEQDITLQVKQENEIIFLSETTQKINRTFWDIISNGEQILPDFIQEALILLGKDGSIIYANNYAINLIETYGKRNQKFLLNRPINEVLTFIKESDFLHNSIVQREIIYLNKVYRLRAVCLKEGEDEGRRVLLNLYDITDLRDKERQLMVKSAVIQEIHHRVKNNLQTIASLLRMQLRKGQPDDPRAFYEESMNRIMSIAMIHEELSYNGIEEVNMNLVINKLAKMLVSQMSELDCIVELKLEIAEIHLEADQAFSLALILTELIQNCLKHAFLGRSQGTMMITFFQNRDSYTLSVMDNGTGIREDHPKNHLGLEIVRNLTLHDLKGSFVIQSLSPSSQGTLASIQFPQKNEVET